MPEWVALVSPSPLRVCKTVIKIGFLRVVVGAIPLVYL